MGFKEKFVACSLGVVLSFSSLVVSAESKSYFGVSIGSVDADTDTTVTGAASLDETDSGFKIYFGIPVSSNVDIELHYADLGEATLSGGLGDTFIVGGSTFSFTADGVSVLSESTSFGVAGLFKLYESNSFNPYLKLGLHRWEVEATSSAPNLSSVSADVTGTDIFFGVGANISLADNLGLKVEFESYKLDEVDTAFASLGAIYRF